MKFSPYNWGVGKYLINRSDVLLSFLKLLSLFVQHPYFFALYIKGQIFPQPLSKEDEKKYLDLWQNGDLDARNKLIEHNLRLVAHIAKKYENNKEDQEDLISIGTIGLIKGVDEFLTRKRHETSNLCGEMYRQ